MVNIVSGSLHSYTAFPVTHTLRGCGINPARETRRKGLPKNHATGVDQKHTPGQPSETVHTARKLSQVKDGPADTAAVTDKSPTTYSANELGDSDDSSSMDGYCNLLLSDDELDVDMVDDVIMSSCTCGANNRAHKRTCPMSS